MMNPNFSFSNLTDSLFGVKMFNMNINIKSVTNYPHALKK